MRGICAHAKAVAIINSIFLLSQQKSTRRTSEASSGGRRTGFGREDFYGIFRKAGRISLGFKTI
jgi:hypothetical protein